MNNHIKNCLIISVFFLVGNTVFSQGTPVFDPNKTKGITTNPTSDQLLTQEQYELKYYSTSLIIKLKRGADDIRSVGQLLNATVIFTDGTTQKVKFNVDVSPLNVFKYEPKKVGGYDVPNQYEPSSEWGSLGLTFTGSEKRIHKVEVYIFENSRLPIDNEDNCDITTMELVVTTTDTKTNYNKARNKVIYTKIFERRRVNGSGVLLSDVINPLKPFPSRVKTDMPTYVAFSIMNSGDGMKGGYSQAKFLVELKSGGVLETDIPNGTKAYYFIRGKTTQAVKWEDIKRIGVRYIYPSNAFDRDDWVIRGLAVDYDSPFLGPVRIFTDWTEKRINGDGSGTTWWSGNLSLP